ncbi:glycosyltransferase [Akkermansiaceae bacterium]|nr:glycosyltransferase [Akkermansiaceae bacterium]MDB4041084.1 glycosyltransferase [Akkermansiaceae bacterium]MDB4412240.1 glycosyltransferase [Akkermansiaceae bacterium]
MIRTPYEKLEDPAFWDSLEVDGVVLYGWGAGKYHKIAKAIKNSGIFFVSHLDTAGILGLSSGIRAFYEAQWNVLFRKEDRAHVGLYRFLIKAFRGSTIGLVSNDLRRAMHLRHADVIGAISPIAQERIKKACRLYGGDALAGKVRLIPHPNGSYMLPSPDIPKERLVIAVGRWDDEKVKGTDLLMKVVERLEELDPKIRFEIYGEATGKMERWHAALSESGRAMITLKGIVPNTEVMRALQRARVSLCTSLHESYHAVSAEALCCGCSVVGPDIAEIPSMKWFTEEGSGTLAPRTRDGLAEAIVHEMAEWDRGNRDAQTISEQWSKRLHAPEVARLILDLAANSHRTPEKREAAFQ